MTERHRVGSDSRTEDGVQLRTDGVGTRAVGHAEEAARDMTDLRLRVRELEAENVQLRGLLRLTPDQARRPAPAQTAIFDVTPGSVSGLRLTREGRLLRHVVPISAGRVRDAVGQQP